MHARSSLYAAEACRRKPANASASPRISCWSKRTGVILRYHRVTPSCKIRPRAPSSNAEERLAPQTAGALPRRPRNHGEAQQSHRSAVQGDATDEQSLTSYGFPQRPMFAAFPSLSNKRCFHVSPPTFSASRNASTRGRGEPTDTQQDLPKNSSPNKKPGLARFFVRRLCVAETVRA